MDHDLLLSRFINCINDILELLNSIKTTKQIFITFNLGFFNKEKKFHVNIGHDFIKDISTQCQNNNITTNTAKTHGIILSKTYYCYNMTPFDIEIVISESNDPFPCTLSIGDSFFQIEEWYFHFTHNTFSITCHYTRECERLHTPFYIVHSGLLKIRDIVLMIEPHLNDSITEISKIIV